jgi:aminoglycoside 6-adenylyltransferase
VRSIAPVWVVLPFDHPDGRRERLVFFAGGAKVDLQIVPAARLQEMATEGLDDLHRRGYEALFDRDGSAARLPPSPHATPRRPRPTAEEFLAVCTEFWFEAAHIPRYLAREELWVVKFRDWTMKRQLLRVLEWHALAEHGDEVDVWHIGTHAQSWLAPGVWERLHEVFAHFDAPDSFRALQATADLFLDLSRDVARAFELPFPHHMSEAVRRHITALPTLDLEPPAP